MDDGTKGALILILAAANIALVYWFQHYIGINGVEWLAWIGYSVGAGLISEGLKGIVRS